MEWKKIFKYILLIISLGLLIVFLFYWGLAKKYVKKNS